MPRVRLQRDNSHIFNALIHLFCKQEQTEGVQGVSCGPGFTLQAMILCIFSVTFYTPVKQTAFRLNLFLALVIFFERGEVNMQFVNIPERSRRIEVKCPPPRKVNKSCAHSIQP